MDQARRRSAGQRLAPECDVVCQVIGAQYRRGHVGHMAKDTRDMVIAQEGRRIAATRAELVLRDLFALG